MVETKAIATTSKWLTVDDPKSPVGKVAAAALAARLKRVDHYLPLAATSAEDDVEYVHQLRVATRRGMTALEVFAECCPRRRGKRMTKRLKHIRRAAGPARDDDVLAMRLEKMADENPQGGAAFLLSQVRAHRDESQTAITEIFRELEAEDFQGHIEKLLSRIRWRGKSREPSFRKTADRALHAALDTFNETARRDLSDAAKLHELRIEGKHLRYAMEVFASAYPNSFRKKLYPLVEQAQELLGAINDHATGEVRFSRWRESCQDQQAAQVLEEMIADEQAALARTRDEFFAWWTPKRHKALCDGFQAAFDSSPSR